MSTILFCGDPHGRYDHVFKAIDTTAAIDRPGAVIFLGDLEPQVPLSEIFKRFLDAGIEPWFIHGNHEGDHADTWAHTLDCWERNLHGKVETIAGIRVAGLGGVFRAETWAPPEAPKFRSYEEYLQNLASIQPVRLRADTSASKRARVASSSIFPDVVDTLSRLKADVLVTHEGPSCHPFGFETIDRLARAMGVKKLLHGHLHQDRSYGNELGFDAYQVGLRGIRDLSGGIVRIGDPE